MEHAKKLLLVEPRLLEQLQANSEYKELTRDPSTKLKAKASGSVRSALVDDGSEMPDDIKAKLYRQRFSHMMSVKNKIPEEPKRRRPLHTTVLPRLLEEEDDDELERSVLQSDVEQPDRPLTRSRKQLKKKTDDVLQLLAEKEKQKRNIGSVILQKAALQFIDNPTKKSQYADYLKQYWKREEQQQRKEGDDDDDDDLFLDAESPKHATARRPASTSSVPVKKSGRGFRWIKY